MARVSPHRDAVVVAGRHARDFAPTFVARFWARVEKRGEDECWPWTGKLESGGYGVVRDCYTRRKVHRVAWELTHGERIAPHLYACHRCGNRACCNPRHVYPGTATDNNRDTVRHGRHKTQRLTFAQVAEIRRRASQGESGTALAHEFGVGREYVYRLKAGGGRRWNGGGA
jgi:HNH endonuclease